MKDVVTTEQFDQMIIAQAEVREYIERAIQSGAIRRDQVVEELEANDDDVVDIVYKHFDDEDVAEAAYEAIMMNIRVNPTY